jgi:high-affinity Fe2+/Pb2+ permease
MLHTRLLAAMAGAAILVVAIGLGWADTARSLDLLAGRVVSQATVLALVGVVCWLAMAATAGAVVARLLRRESGPRRTVRRGPLTLIVGTILLALGIAHHISGYDVCCANATTSQLAEQRVR